MTTLKPENVDGVAVICESCGTAVSKQTEDEAEQTAFDHNDSMHDGESTAKTVTSVVDIDTSEFSKQKRQRFVKQIMRLLDDE